MKSSWMSDLSEFKDFFSDQYQRDTRQKPLFAAAPGTPGEDLEDEENREDRMKRALSIYPLLYDIPFLYIVPHISFLGEDEIRFFYLDHNWSRAFLDGMFSLGRGTEFDHAHDERMVSSIYHDAFARCPDVRREAQGKEAGGFVLDESEICTGFLMRSKLVRGWRGLEFQAYRASSSGQPDTKNPLLALRIETLSDDILFGLYQGEIARLSISEPPEGLYHGIKSSESGQPLIDIRRISDGSQEADPKLVDVEFRKSCPRVLDITRLAEKMESAIKTSGDKLDHGVTGAHMALQLLRTARKLEIDNEGKGKKT